MRLILFFLRPLYYLLYHQFAWTYDFVANIVSLGQWQSWVQTALPHLSGRVLELGFGSGHLQLSIHQQGFTSFGLDESRFMTSQAFWRLRKAGAVPRLARGLARFLPYPAASFETVAATFPADFILEPFTLDEIQRVLVPGGRLVILPLAWITGLRPLERFVAWLMRITGEAPGQPALLPASIRELFTSRSFELHQEIVILPKSKVLVLLAEKRHGE